MKGISSIVISVCVFGIACGSKKLSGEEFLKQVAANQAYVQQQEAGDLTFTCAYRPSEWLALKETGGKGACDTTRFNKEKRNFDRAVYFDLLISDKQKRNLLIKEVKNQEEYAQRLGELTYNMPQAISAVSASGDTLHPLTVNFSNTYGMSPDLSLTLVFPKKLDSYKAPFKIIYRDQLFNLLSPVVFEYDPSVLYQPLPGIRCE
jgi:hypothetical protein